jgi:hypothetical protein
MIVGNRKKGSRAIRTQLSPPRRSAKPKIADGEGPSTARLIFYFLASLYFKGIHFNDTMSLAATRVIASRTLARRAPVTQQKRGFIDYLTNYPDKVRASCGGCARGDP